MFFSKRSPSVLHARDPADAARPARDVGYEYVAGLEVEFYITRMVDPMLAPGGRATRRTRRR